MDYLIYCNITKATGSKLAEELSISHGESPPRSGVATLIRWGNGGGIGHNPRKVVNKQNAVNLAIDKLAASKTWDERRIRIPKLVTNVVPCIARTRQHTQGQGLWFLFDTAQIAEVKREGADYFIEYIPTAQEWRIHVVDGEIAFVQPKYPTKRRTSAFGGVQGFGNDWHKHVVNPNEAPRQACDVALAGTIALGLDFGGADVVEGLDGKCYLLEINTGPALPTPETRKPYIDYFKMRMAE